MTSEKTKIIALLYSWIDFLKYSTKKTKAYTGENSIFSIKIHTKKWMQAGVISLFYDKKKRWFTAQKVK